MYLEDLPEEILIIIIQKLDLLSVFNLYGVSLRFKNILCSNKIIKTCNLSLTIMNSTQVLQSNFFQDLSFSMEHLNVSGMVNLNKTIFLQVTKRLKNLRNLNVSYTNISLLDFVEIYQVCPSIKSIHINFNLGKNVKVSNNVVLKCRKVFKNMECVHFVGKCVNLLFSQVGLHILEEAKLKTLQYTVIESDTTVYENYPSATLVHFDYLQVCVPSSKNSPFALCHSMYDLFIFDKLDYNNYEFLVIVKKNFLVHTIYTSPLFVDFFKKYFNCNVTILTKFMVRLLGNVSLIIWNKKSTTFDDVFFNKLYKNLKIYFPYILNQCKDITLPLEYDYYIIYPTKEHIEPKNTEDTVCFKKRRIGSPYHILDYSTLFKDKEEIKLCLMLHSITLTVSLSTSHDYLKKITYLSLCGNVKYSIEFFNILFQCCDKLVTLTIESGIGYTCALLANSIPLSHSLKNLLFKERKIDFPRLLSSISKCNTLENIHLIDYSTDAVHVADPIAVFKNCTYLYCFTVYVNITEINIASQLRILNKAKEQSGRKYINANILDNVQILYNPFLDVFKICSIKPIFIQ